MEYIEKNGIEEIDESFFIKKYGKNYKLSDVSNEDYYCWACHRVGKLVLCDQCYRVYHKNCLEVIYDVKFDSGRVFNCPECTVS
jgi:hypothetical protein